MCAAEKATPSSDIGRGSVVRIMRPESYWFQECGTVATVDKNTDARYGATVRFEKVNYAGVATNNFAIDELVLVNNPPAKAKAKAPPAKAAPTAAQAPAAKAMSSKDNVRKFSLVNLFDEPGPKYNVEASGAISVAVQDDYWGNVMHNVDDLA